MLIHYLCSARDSVGGTSTMNSVVFPSISQVDCGILAMGRIAQDTAVESIR